MRIVCVLLLLAVSAAAQKPAKNEGTKVPCVPLYDLSSPDRQWSLFSHNYQLLVQNNKTQSRRFLRLGSNILECINIHGTVCNGIQIGWSPDSSVFFLNDEQASDRTVAYVFTAATGQAVSLAEMLRRHDPDAIRWLRASHAYVYAQRWVGPQELLVNVAGHFDESVTKEFEVQYRVNLASGSVARLSAREHLLEEEPAFQQASKQQVR